MKSKKKPAFIIHGDSALIKARAKTTKEKIDKRALEIIRKHAAETRRHFRTDGWPLDCSHLIEELVTELLGYNPESLFIHEVNKGTPIVLSDEGSGLIVRKGKKS